MSGDQGVQAALAGSIGEGAGQVEVESRGKGCGGKVGEGLYFNMDQEMGSRDTSGASGTLKFGFGAFFPGTPEGRGKGERENEQDKKMALRSKILAGTQRASSTRRVPSLPSKLPAATQRPSGLKATLLTEASNFVRLTSAPVLASSTRRVLSLLAPAFPGTPEAGPASMVDSKEAEVEEG